MMTEYNPDRWVVVKVGGDDPHYRVLGGWSGGYLDGGRAYFRCAGNVRRPTKWFKVEKGEFVETFPLTNETF